jgi:hypothetical protein
MLVGLMLSVVLPLTTKLFDVVVPLPFVGAVTLTDGGLASEPMTLAGVIL